ncbi:hypothetical protein BDN70DRAFT_248578 [Pholiota conissans]|uniref:Uncharacterized protein n=1 Tax=Pholiota conissans TaxID=109636 RepID=A0A9P5YVX1_9AGAR|nr:hypothetical protein BDN70DRAFT_248578 [Pholiota conissans]
MWGKSSWLSKRSKKDGKSADFREASANIASLRLNDQKIAVEIEPPMKAAVNYQNTKSTSALTTENDIKDDGSTGPLDTSQRGGVRFTADNDKIDIDDGRRCNSALEPTENPSRARTAMLYKDIASNTSDSVGRLGSDQYQANSTSGRQSTFETLNWSIFSSSANPLPKQIAPQVLNSFIAVYLLKHLHMPLGYQKTSSKGYR